MSDTHTSSKRPVLISFALFITILLGLFSIQMKSALEGFDRWVGHEDHRLPNILQIEKACRWPVVNRFMALQPLSKADAFIFGDSQMFARGATQEELFYSHWLGEDATIINFSYFGGPVGDMHQIAQELEQRGHKATYSYTALNLTHFTNNIHAPQVSEKPNVSDGVLPKKPNSLSSIWQNRFICAFRYRKSFIGNELRTPRYRKLTGDFKKTPLPDSYIAFERKYFDRVVLFYFEDYPDIAKQMIVASAPIAYDKFPDYNFDESYLRKFEIAYSEFCNVIPAPLRCLDLVTKISSDGFGDMIHMNDRGHKALGEKLRQEFPG